MFIYIYIRGGKGRKKKKKKGGKEKKKKKKRKFEMCVRGEVEARLHHNDGKAARINPVIHLGRNSRIFSRQDVTESARECVIHRELTDGGNRESSGILEDKVSGKCERVVAKWTLEKDIPSN